MRSGFTSPVRVFYVATRLEGLAHTRDIRRPRVDEEIDVFRGARAAVRDDGEPADQHVPDMVRVQRAGEADEIIELRLTCVRAIMRVIHASASSKLLNRYTPRGPSEPVRRTAAMVRCNAAGSCLSVRRWPTVFSTLR
jgi:hypothetical protein